MVGVRPEEGYVRQELDGLHVQISACRGPALACSDYERLAKGQDEEIMDVPQDGHAVLAPCVLVVRIEMEHEDTLIKYVEQPAAMELDRIDQEDRIICSWQ